MGQGKVDECVEHIANAVSVCGQPQQLLGVLQQTLPPKVFSSLIDRLPIVGQVCSLFIVSNGKHYLRNFKCFTVLLNVTFI